MLFRLILLLAIAGGLTVFALSNGSTLALTFLGMQTPTLPLSLWVLGAIAAGAITHLLIAALFRLSNLLVATEVRSQIRRSERRRSSERAYQPRGGTQRPASSDDADWKDWEGYEEPSNRQPQPPEPRPAARTQAQAPIDDWEGDFSDDWEEPSLKPRPKPEPRPNPSVSGASAYSPPKQTPSRSETRSPEGSVVDADFRVLVPPTRPAPEPVFQPDNADDWFEDDDLETDAERRRRSGL